MIIYEMSAEEVTTYPNLVKHGIAWDAIVLIVNPSNPVNELALNEIRGIYNGTITRWSEVGGADQINYIMIARYLERCGDHACKIAEKVHYMVTGERIEIK
jgi:ABC-type phosphate transport system substrate-binding protein